jgi:hypothetical protein
MNPFQEIDGVLIPFDKSWKNIAISLSGGADSALLTYLLCSMIDHHTTVHCINHTRMWKTRPWQSWYYNNVFNWFEERFSNIDFVRHVNFISPELEYGNIGPTVLDEYGKLVSGDNIEKRAFAEYICYTNNIDAHYNAVTRNPKGVDFSGMIERDVDPTPENRHLEIKEHMGRWACHPFRFIDKRWIVKQYRRLDIMELFEITRSCEGEFQGLDYKTYVQGQEVPTCGKCFWCKEREWAVEQNQ